MSSNLPEQDCATTLVGAFVRLVGPLASMPLREASGLIAFQGGRVVGSLDEATLIVVGDGASPDKIAAVRRDADSAVHELLTESQFLQRLLDADRGAAVRGLHSPSMLAEVARAPVAAIRRWWRRGYLQPTHELGSLPLFDLSEAQVARRLADLLASGCSLSQIDTWVTELDAHNANDERPLASSSFELRDGRLLIRKHDRLTELNGQVVVDFEAPGNESLATEEAPVRAPDDDLSPAAIRMPDPIEADTTTPDALRAQAWDLADRGAHAQAIEACRLVLLSDDARPEDHFLLAQLFYEQGDAAAARERYYMAIECDDSYVEARISLGCVLGELGDHELAAAVLLGAVEAAPGLADAQYHLAAALDEVGHHEASETHWRRFLELSPVGPWSDRARERIAAGSGSLTLNN